MMMPTESVVMANIMNIKNVNQRITAMFCCPDSVPNGASRLVAVVIGRDGRQHP